jgi:hypothetical protein
MKQHNKYIIDMIEEGLKKEGVSRRDAIKMFRF